MAVYVEDYIPVIKYQGFNTLKAATFGSTMVVTGTLTSGQITTVESVISQVAGVTVGRMYPIVSPGTAPTAYAADTTLVAANLNTNITNTGASGTITLTLPAVAGLNGYIAHVELTVAQVVRVDPAGTEIIYLGGSGVAGKYANIAGVIGNMIDIYCTGVAWLIVNRDGVITKEA